MELKVTKFNGEKLGGADLENLNVDGRVILQRMWNLPVTGYGLLLKLL
jgi:hypothetical protein